MTDKVTPEQAKAAFREATSGALESLKEQSLITDYSFVKRDREVDGKTEAFVDLIINESATATSSSTTVMASEFPAIRKNTILARAHEAVLSLVRLWEMNQMEADGIDIGDSSKVKEFGEWYEANHKKYELQEAVVTEVFEREMEPKS